MRVKEKVADFKQKCSKTIVKRVILVGGMVMLVGTAGVLTIRIEELKKQICSLMATQGINGLSKDDLSIIKEMYGDIRELDNAALGIAAKGLNPWPTIERATAYERAVLEDLRR